MKLSASTKIAVGFVLVVSVSYFGYQRWAEYQAFQVKYEPIAPKEVNLIGIAPGAGYQIIVANQIAALTEGSASGLEAPEGDRSTIGEVTGRRRIPIRELIQTLQGDEEAFSRLLMRMNDLEIETLPPDDLVWDAADIRQALDGHPVLQERLEEALNVRLDGTPLPTLNRDAVFEGIVIRLPVRMTVEVAGQPKEIVGYVTRPYKASLMRRVFSEIETKFDVTDGMLAGYYAEFANPILEGSEPKEDVRRQLESRIDDREAQNLAAAPRRVIEQAVFIINEDHMESATAHTYAGPRNARLTDLRIRLTTEGRNRLWQYSRRRGAIGSQLLLVVNGIPIAAPTVTTELSGQEVTIAQLPDESLALDMVERIAQSRQAASRG